MAFIILYPVEMALHLQNSLLLPTSNPDDFLRKLMY